MHKRASRVMQHALRVDQINPSKGYISGVDDISDPNDVIRSVEAMPMAELNDERDRLKIENQRWLSEVAAAKVSGDLNRAIRIGSVQQSIQARLSLINSAIKKLNAHRAVLEMNAFKALVVDEIGHDRMVELMQQAALVASLNDRQAA